jgi:hypothetical protein
MLDHFQKMGVRAERVFAVVGAQSEADITLDHLAQLTGLKTAIREGDTTVDDAFPEIRPGHGPVQMPQRAEATPPNSPGAAPTTESASTTSTAPAATPAAPAPDLIYVTALDKQHKNDAAKTPYWRVAFSNGVRGVTFALGDVLETALRERSGFRDIKSHEAAGFTYIDAVGA